MSAEACERWAATLAEGPEAVLADAGARAHVATCLGCQADMAAYRWLRRSMRALRADAVDPGPELLRALLDAGRHRRPARRRVAFGALGGLAAAATAGAAGALVSVARSRRAALAG